MSSLVNKSVLNVGVVALLAGYSFMASAEKLSFSQVVGFHVAQRVAEVQYYLDADVEQSVYADAYADVSNQVNAESRRTVVKVSDIKSLHEDEE